MTIPDLQRCKRDNKKIIVVTAYDALFARLLEQAGIELLLVGDSLGVVVQGKSNTLSVTMEDMLYHTRLVAGAAQKSLIIGDMPFMSYQASQEEALRNAGRFLQAGAHAVKLEGGAEVIESASRILAAGVPVMGHLGLTPQSIYKFGTYTVRAKEEAEAEKLKADAKLLEQAGCFAIVLEKIPATLAKEVSESLQIPTIGIGAGRYCDGQVLVMHDMLGINTEFKPRFLRQYLNLHEQVTGAVQQYIKDVKARDFPSENEQY